MSFRPAPGELLAGKYRLERRIGKGGMGQVWVATHVELDRLVAVKFIDPRLGDQKTARARFTREAKTAARVPSQHIVGIYDHGIDGGVPYIVMELLEGEDLAELLSRQGRLSTDIAVRVLLQAAKGVQQAHEQGVVHRDLKPRNLFLTRDGEDVIVKILDFGVAKADWSKGGETKTGDIVGSPHYMSPEQVHGAKRVDHRSDLWSLAVILFRALTGKRPFPGQGVGEIIVAICTDPPLMATQLAADLPPAIDGFFERALARNPDQRFQSAPELANALMQAVGLRDPDAPLTWSRLRAEALADAPDAAAGDGPDDDEKTVRTPSSQSALSGSIDDEVELASKAGVAAAAGDVSSASPGATEPAAAAKPQPSAPQPAAPAAPASVEQPSVPSPSAAVAPGSPASASDQPAIPPAAAPAHQAAVPSAHSVPSAPVAVPASSAPGAAEAASAPVSTGASSSSATAVPAHVPAQPASSAETVEPQAMGDPSLNAPSYGTLASTHQSLWPKLPSQHVPILWGAGAAVALAFVLVLVVAFSGDESESAAGGSLEPAGIPTEVESEVSSPASGDDETSTAEGGGAPGPAASGAAAPTARASTTVSAEATAESQAKSKPPPTRRRPKSQPGSKRRERLGY